MPDTNSKTLTYVAPVLPTDVIAVARILEDAGLLDCLTTRSVLAPRIAKLLRTSKVTESFSRRPASPVSRERVRASWLADLVYYANRAIGKSSITAADKSFARVDRIAAKSLNSETAAVLAREDCCVRCFARAKELGLTTIYQLPTAYWTVVRQLMSREIAEFAENSIRIEDPDQFGQVRVQRKVRELELADYVLCPSSFVYNSLPVDRQDRYKMIPLAINAPDRAMNASRKPVFMYAGNITIRKGVHRLLEAWKRLKAYRTHELRLIGDMYLSQSLLGKFAGTFKHIGRISRRALDRHYLEASVFVFNPIADGFGQVILEAMSFGVPVIASRNCGAPDIITDQREGRLIDYGSDEQLCTALEDALRSPERWSEMGRAARDRVGQQSWNEFGRELLEWLGAIGVRTRSPVS